MMQYQLDDKCTLGIKGLRLCRELAKTDIYTPYTVYKRIMCNTETRYIVETDRLQGVQYL